MTRLLPLLLLAACMDGPWAPEYVPEAECADLCAAVCRCGIDWRADCRDSCIADYETSEELYECAFACVSDWPECSDLRWCLWDCPGNGWQDWEGWE